MQAQKMKFQDWSIKSEILRLCLNFARLYKFSRDHHVSALLSVSGAPLFATLTPNIKELVPIPFSYILSTVAKLLKYQENSP